MVSINVPVGGGEPEAAHPGLSGQGSLLSPICQHSWQTQGSNRRHAADKTKYALDKKHPRQVRKGEGTSGVQLQ